MRCFDGRLFSFCWVCLGGDQSSVAADGGHAVSEDRRRPRMDLRQALEGRGALPRGGARRDRQGQVAIQA